MVCVIELRPITPFVRDVAAGAATSREEALH
jgi:hypothetical protein